MIKVLHLIWVISFVACARVDKTYSIDESKIECSQSVSSIIEKVSNSTIEYYEGYGYGVSIDTSVLNYVRKHYACAYCALKKLESSPSLLKMHLVLSSLQKGGLQLESYDLIETASEESLTYTVNTITWSRPVSSYQNISLMSDIHLIKKYWEKRLSIDKPCAGSN